MITYTVNYLRFMRYENVGNPNLINIYPFARLVFGLACSPFILNATVKVYVQKYVNDEAIRILTQFLRDMYVDNTATSFNLSSEALDS